MSRRTGQSFNVSAFLPLFALRRPRAVPAYLAIF